MKRKATVLLLIVLIFGFAFYELYKYFYASEKPVITYHQSIDEGIILSLKNKYNLPVSRNDLFYSITVPEKYMGLKIKEFLQDIKFKFNHYEPIHPNTLNKKIKDYNELELIPSKNNIKWIRLENLDGDVLKQVNIAEEIHPKILNIANKVKLPLERKTVLLKDLFKSNLKNFEILKRFVILSEN